MFFLCLFFIFLPDCIGLVQNRDPVQIQLLPQNVSQNSVYLSHVASFAIDNDPTTYSSTSPNETSSATWQVVMNDYYHITQITINRANCCPETPDINCCGPLLQDILVEIMDFNGSLTQDFDKGSGGSQTFITSRQNIDGYLGDLSSIDVDLLKGPTRGNFVRIIREPSLSETTNERKYVLAISEVVIQGIPNVCSSCDINAECIGDTGLLAYCKCKEGYYGDGYTCIKTLGEPGSFITPIEVEEVTTTWKTIQFPSNKTFNAPVVVCTPSYDPFKQNLTIVRIRNAYPSSFDIRIQNIQDLPLPPTRVYCIVVNQGVYDGMEVTIHVASTTDHYGSWIGEVGNYVAEYTNPVVLGQVMSAYDPKWTSFWSSSISNASLPASTDGLRVGKHSGHEIRDPVYEVIGYIVCEAGLYSQFEAAVAALSIQGVSTYRTRTHLEGVVLSSAGMDNSYWPVLINNTDTEFNYYGNVDVSSQENISMNASILALNGSMFNTPSHPCYNKIEVCSCISTPDCVWCLSYTAGSVCYPNDPGSKTFCTEIRHNNWITQSASCTSEIPVPPSPTPSDTPVQPQDPCIKYPDICNCISLTSCAWCKVLQAGYCASNILDNEAMCKNHATGKGIWISPGPCNISQTHSASHTLSAFGQKTSEGSAVATLVLGCIIAVVAIGTSLWIFKMRLREKKYEVDKL